MKNKIKNITIFVLYLLYDYIAIDILNYFGINYVSLEFKYKILFFFIINLLFMIFMFFLYKKEIKEDAIDFKKNGKEYISKYINVYLIGIIAMSVSNLIIQKITNVPLSGNETKIRELIDSIPLYMFFSSVLYAPFIEEMIFRKVIRNLTKKDYLFIIISGLVFGALHISDYTNYKEILLGIPYILMGLDFAYIYYKTNNIFTTMTFHLFHNLILLIIQLL